MHLHVLLIQHEMKNLFHQSWLFRLSRFALQLINRERDISLIRFILLILGID